MRAALLLVLATMCCALAAQDDAALITKNLTEGERALRAGRFLARAGGRAGDVAEPGHVH